MDVIAHHFEKSVFNKLNSMWWDQKISWRNKYNNPDLDMFLGKRLERKKWFFGLLIIPSALTDGWHFFKMLMVIFIVFAIITSSYDLGKTIEIVYYIFNKAGLINTLVDLLIYNTLVLLIFSYIAWNGTFILFYKYILRK